jgi:hypothetical protein
LARKDKERTADPVKIAEYAEAFVKTGRLLRREIAGDHLHHLTISLVVNASLALELYLKCLSVCERGVYIEDHDLKELYYDISPDTRSEIERRHKELEGDVSFNRARSVGIALNVNNLLELGRDVFVKWRYGFEHPEAFSVWNLDGLLLVVRRYLLENYIELKDLSDP